MSSRAKQAYLETFDKEHATTVRILKAFPEDKLDLQPAEKSPTARRLAWTFALERRLGMAVWNDAFASGVPAGRTPPPPPEKWSDELAEMEKAHAEFRAVIANASDEELSGKVHFFVAPKTLGEMSRLDFAWFLLHDEIHHRGQFSVYLRIAGAKVPSIYGPTADEPWM